MTDVRQGMVDDDAKVADMLRRSKKPIVLVVNKVDSFEKFMPDVYGVSIILDLEIHILYQVHPDLE